MIIKKADEKYLNGINKLLYQVLDVHYKGRPDLFKKGSKKYTDDELLNLLKDNSRPVFVALNESDNVLGYAFCVLEDNTGDNMLADIKTLYIDDLCVDESKRGTHIGKELYEYVLAYAKKIGCYNVTLNVWSCNSNAISFYEHCGLKPYKIGMEKIL